MNAKDMPDGHRESEGDQRGYGRPAGYGYGGPSGYGYGGYPGYGFGQVGGESDVHKTLQDYVLILRERRWYIATAFLVVFAAALLLTYSEIPLYQSTATVQIFRKEALVMQVQQVMDNQVNSAEDLNTQVNILKSATIVQRVADQLKGEDLHRFIRPYTKVRSPEPNPLRILTANREIVPERLSLIIDIQYKHPDREVAAKIANLFADEYIAYNAHVQVDESIKAVEELQQRADAQRRKVDDIANALQAYRERNHMVSLDQRRDIVTERLKDLSTHLTQSSAALQDAQTKWKQVEEVQAAGGNLLDLPFIADTPLIEQLRQQVAAQKVALAQLSQRYRAKHPQMIAAMNSLREGERQLSQAIDTARAQVQAAFQTTLQDYTKAQQSLATQETDSLTLDHYAVDYSNLERDYEVNEKLLEQILERMHETSVSGTIENQSGRIVDRAAPGRIPVSPNYKLNLGLGALGGVLLGISLAFLVAYLDDRVKSAADIELVVGLPLLGIIPEILKLGQAEEMQHSMKKSPDREAAEAFATLYSALQLRNESKNAQCILVTSTIAGEGKSFICTYLAQTYAAHGMKTVIIDCDLRRPAVHRVFHLENLKGVIDVVEEGAPLDTVIAKNVQPNLDVIPTGGRSKNPTQSLNSKEFALMLSELRKRYDKVFVDTPPIAIVSDAMVILPLVDGSIYSLYFNKVRRKTAQYAAKRLLEANIPNFGAILNGLNGGLGGYYYSHYYDKSYKAYYVNTDDNDLRGK